MGQQGKTPKCFSIIFYMTDCKQFKSLSLLNFRNRTSCAISSRINGLSFYVTLCPLSLYSHYHPLKHPTCLICQVGNTPCDPQLPPCWAVPQFCLLWAEENWNHKLSAVCPLLRCQISQKNKGREWFWALCHLCCVVRIDSGGLTNRYIEGSPLHVFFLLGKAQMVTRSASFCVVLSKKNIQKFTMSKQYRAIPSSARGKKGAKATLTVLGEVGMVPPDSIRWIRVSGLFGCITQQDYWLQPSVFPSSSQDCRANVL